MWRGTAGWMAPHGEDLHLGMTIVSRNMYGVGSVDLQVSSDASSAGDDRAAVVVYLRYKTEGMSPENGAYLINLSSPYF